jgi:hypothetical protein
MTAPLHCRDFCDYLARERLLPTEHIEEVRRGASAPQIGKILLDRGALDVRQLMNIVYQQADHPEMRFGELAVRAGYISEQELLLALREQRLLRRHPAEILLEQGAMEPAHLVRALVGYTKLQESALIHLDHLTGKPVP